MLPRRILLTLSVGVMLLTFVGYFQYFKVVMPVTNRITETSPEGFRITRTGMRYPLNLNKDVLVMLRIPRTGIQALTRHIADNSDIRPHCETRFGTTRNATFGWECRSEDNATWLVSGLSTGHIYPVMADYTTLVERLDNIISKHEHSQRTRRYHYVTMLREPLQRFQSEFFQLKRTGYPHPKLSCNGEAIKQPGLKCFRRIRSVKDNASFTTFVNCPENPAVNRQTRMLANLQVVNCYNRTGMSETERNRKLLHSAKQTLLKMSFFGLTEYQHLTQKMFERTFNLKFLIDFRQSMATVAKFTTFPPHYIKLVTAVNTNDIELYEFAKHLFMTKARYFNLI